MKFNNRPNICHNIPAKTETGLETTRILWESRSVAVVCVVLLWKPFCKEPWVLVSQRGPNSADYQGLYNVVCGYLDWDETGFEAVLRETWEEVGLKEKRKS